jgi:hypothetical protein
VTFRAQIALTKHDGAVLAEVCRDKACSRAVIDASTWATWPGERKLRHPRTLIRHEKPF